MTYALNDYIYIICKQSCYIKELKISGPIHAPIKVKMSTAYNIIARGIKLYQYNPDTKEFALMTVSNAFRKDKFKSFKEESVEKDDINNENHDVENVQIEDREVAEDTQDNKDDEKISEELLQHTANEHHEVDEVLFVEQKVDEEQLEKEPEEVIEDAILEDPSKEENQSSKKKNKNKRKK